MTRLLPWLHAAAGLAILGALGTVAVGVTAFVAMQRGCGCAA